MFESFVEFGPDTSVDMDDEAFIAYVLNNAPRYEIETLEKIAHGLRNVVESRRWGKPLDLQIGSNVEATMFDSQYREYGTVISMSPQTCTIERAGSQFAPRLAYKKYAIRVLDEFEWNRVVSSVEHGRAKYEEEREREEREEAEDRAAALRDRERAVKKAKSMVALNGTFPLHRGAFVHALRPDWGTDEYGVIVAMSATKIVLSSEESASRSSVSVAKHEIEILSAAQWEVVGREQRRRRDEYEQAKRDGRTDTLPDYSLVEIPLSGE